MVERESVSEIEESSLVWQAVLSSVGSSEVSKAWLNDRPHLEVASPHGCCMCRSSWKANRPHGFGKCLGGCAKYLMASFPPREVFPTWPCPREEAFQASAKVKVLMI